MAESRKLLGEFLIELAENKELLDEYLEDPRRVAAAFGLTEEQQQVLASYDLRRIRDFVRDEYQKAEVLVFAIPMGHFSPMTDDDSEGDGEDEDGEGSAS